MILWNDNSLASNTCYAYAVNHGKKKKGKRKSWLKQQLKNCMAKNDFRVTSIFKIIIRICMKNVELCEKMSVHFLYFLFKWKGVKPTSMSNKICRKQKMKFLTLPLTKKERERESEREEQKRVQLQKLQFQNSWKIVLSYTSY